jgi:hypothetical protein
MEDHRLSLTFWAVGLITGGLFLLLIHFNLLAAYEPTAQYIMAGTLIVGAVGFFAAFLRQPANWWRLVPAWTGLARALMVFIGAQPDYNRRYTAALLIAGQALAFSHIFWVNRIEHWWAVIPGGFLWVLSGVIAASVYISRLETLGALLFVGMGAVFVLLYLLAGRRRHWWALIPASVLGLFGLLIYTVEGAVQNALLRWWPATLIAAGLFLAYRALTWTPPPPKFMVNSATRLPPPSGTSRSAPTASQTTQDLGTFGEYSAPAPGANVTILPDPDEKPRRGEQK